MMKLHRLIDQVKRKHGLSDFSLAESLRGLGVECTNRAIWAWRNEERLPEHNARMWIEMQLNRLLRKKA